MRQRLDSQPGLASRCLEASLGEEDQVMRFVCSLNGIDETFARDPIERSANGGDHTLLVNRNDVDRSIRSQVRGQFIEQVKRRGDVFEDIPERDEVVLLR